MSATGGAGRGGRGGRGGGRGGQGRGGQGRGGQGGSAQGAGRGRGRGRGRPERRIEDARYSETVVKIMRNAKVVKGGRRFSFAALVVVGDGNGEVGIGHGKANGVPDAVDKGVKDAMKQLFKVPLIRAKTIPHPVVGRYGASLVYLWPAAPGTGVIAGAAVKAVLTAAGVGNILTKVHGSTNPVNVLKATCDALKKLRTRESVAALRGVELGDYNWPPAPKKETAETEAAATK